MMCAISSSEQISTTSIGRSLLTWYCIIEDYYAFSTASHGFLPESWRKGRTNHDREELSSQMLKADETHITHDGRARLLNDLWLEYHAMVPSLTNITAELKILPSLSPEEKSKTSNRLLARLQSFPRNFANFTKSQQMLDILRYTVIKSPTLENWHTDGCPQLSFQLCKFEFPPAGLLSLVCNCVELLIRAIYLPVLSQPSSNESHLEKDIAESYAYDFCCTYPGLELSFQHGSPDHLLPCFLPLFTAAFCCPPPLRSAIP